MADSSCMEHLAEVDHKLQWNKIWILRGYDSGRGGQEIISQAFADLHFPHLHHPQIAQLICNNSFAFASDRRVLVCRVQPE